jgi:hypothetical protein
MLSDCRTVDVACRHVWKLRLHFIFYYLMRHKSHGRRTIDVAVCVASLTAPRKPHFRVAGWFTPYQGKGKLPTCFFSPIQSQSQSHIATDSQSVGLSWCRAPSGAYDQKLVYWFNCRKLQSRLWGRPLWREVGSVVCQSVICVRSLSVGTVYLQNLLNRIKWSALYTIFTRPLSHPFSQVDTVIGSKGESLELANGSRNKDGRLALRSGRIHTVTFAPSLHINRENVGRQLYSNENKGRRTHRRARAMIHV